MITGSSTTMVCFTAAGASYCLPVTATRAVRRTTGLVVLPDTLPDIAGLIPGDPPLTVISPLGAGGEFVIVVETGDRTFGLQVDAVTGLRRIDDADVLPAPSGQQRTLVGGTIEADGELVMLVDPTALELRT